MCLYFVSHIHYIFEQRQSDDKIRENHAFELLFLHVGLQLFTDAEGAVESLQVREIIMKLRCSR